MADYVLSIDCTLTSAYDAYNFCRIEVSISAEIQNKGSILAMGEALRIILITEM